MSVSRWNAPTHGERDEAVGDGLGGTLAVLAAGAAYGMPAHAAGGSYVALGDSYSSGVGTRTYLDDGTDCQRSVYAYPSLIASARGYALTFRACSGATTSDVTATQLDALSSSTTYVTMSIGGNDAGFADVLTECALPGWASDCDGSIDTAQAFISGTLPARLASLYASIRSKAPNAEVVVVGYPRVFQGEDCNAATFFSPEEEARLNTTADQLDSLLASQASAAGFGFANPTSAFLGHAVCDDPEWLNGFSNPISDSYHPNVAGHANGYTPLVSGVLSTAPVTVDAAVLRRAAASTSSLTAQARSYAARDASITPKEFRAPDLSSPRVVAAAKRAGVDLSSPASIRAADDRSNALHEAARAAR